jgi:L-lactate permease
VHIVNLLAINLAITPILLILILLVVRRLAVDIAGTLGWLATILITWLYFKTPQVVTIQASLVGMIASLPIALMVAASILQVTLMLETGAIARVVVLIKTISPGNQIVQMVLINIGFGTLLTALVEVSVSILPLAMGYSKFVAMALPAIGYDALNAFGRLYPLAAPFLGLMGGFISGSETSSIAMCSALHLSTAEKIGTADLLIAATSGIGGSLASVISPSSYRMHLPPSIGSVKKPKSSEGRFRSRWS